MKNAAGHDGQQQPGPELVLLASEQRVHREELPVVPVDVVQPAGDDRQDDADRDLPPGIEEFLGPGEWPDAPWPGSVYDWEAWEDPETGDEIHQISIRFCPLGQAENCHFPNQDWAEDFDYYSSVYFCLEGVCRSHINRPVDHPGYCVNCED